MQVDASASLGPATQARLPLAPVVPSSWSQFILSTLDKGHVKSARHGKDWQIVHGNSFATTDRTLTHNCDATCRRWVLRPDGLRFCAISGLCVDRLQSQSKSAMAMASTQSNAPLTLKRCRSMAPAPGSPPQQRAPSPSATATQAHRWPQPMPDLHPVKRKHAQPSSSVVDMTSWEQRQTGGVVAALAKAQYQAGRSSSMRGGDFDEASYGPGASLAAMMD